MTCARPDSTGLTRSTRFALFARAVLAIVCVHVLALQERRVSVYTFGGRDKGEKVGGQPATDCRRVGITRNALTRGALARRVCCGVRGK